MNSRYYSLLIISIMFVLIFIFATLFYPDPFNYWLDDYSSLGDKYSFNNHSNIISRIIYVSGFWCLAVYSITNRKKYSLKQEIFLNDIMIIGFFGQYFAKSEFPFLHLFFSTTAFSAFLSLLAIAHYYENNHKFWRFLVIPLIFYIIYSLCGLKVISFIDASIFQKLTIISTILSLYIGMFISNMSIEVFRTKQSIILIENSKIN